MSEISPQWNHVTQGLNEVRSRIRRAAAAAGRQDGDVTLVAVSKTFPAAAICAAAAAGQRDFGENYVQEALPKIAEVEAMLAADIVPSPIHHPAGACLPSETGDESRNDGAVSVLSQGLYGQCAAGQPRRPLVWHFIGPIQSNKTRDIAERFDWVHGIEREKIARRLSEQRPAGMPPLNACIQVNVSGEASKSGVSPQEVSALAGLAAGLPGLKLRGLMAIPEPDGDPRPHFRLLRELLEELNARGLALDTLSMGMSGDFETAIAEGASIVRVGSAIFGRRNYAK